MKKSNLIAVDLAKNTFQVCSFQPSGKIQFNRAMKPSAFTEFMANQAPSKVAFEACSSAHHYARTVHSMGHTPVIMPPKIVAAYRQGHKTDKQDAQAIGHTAQQPSIKSVGIKSLGQQNAQTVLRNQKHISDQLTATSNMLRGLLMEFGICIPKGYAKLRGHLSLALEDTENGLDSAARAAIKISWDLFNTLSDSLKATEQLIETQVKQRQPSCHLLQLEGVGPKNALALYADIGSGEGYSNGRSAAACIGLTPKQHSTGGKTHIGHIAKGYQGNTRLRSSLITGAIAVLNVLDKREPRNEKEVWLKQLMQRRGKGRTAVALANKTVRTAWAMLANNEPYRKPVPFVC